MGSLRYSGSYQKIRGGYYTPKLIADFLARWAIQSPAARILEPSCGDGVLLESSLKVLVELGASKKQAVGLVEAIEIDRAESLKAVERLRPLGFPAEDSMVHGGDFFAYCEGRGPRAFDAVVGNPPFIRYQNFLEEHRRPAFEIMRRAGMKPSRLTNSWVPFLVASSLLLTERGRLAMVVPAELLQVSYAAELRRFLGDYFNKLTVITFRRLVFEGVQQEVVLLLGERGGGRAGVRTVELDSVSDLASYGHAGLSPGELKPVDHTAEKWTQYFLSNREIHLLRALREHPELILSGRVIDVDVGVVTGRNQFFVLTDERAGELSLKQHARRVVGRSGHLKGAIFSEADWLSNARRQSPAYLLDLPRVPYDELPKAAREYVTAGEEEGLNKGFKCRIRNPWYFVPSVWVPDAFMLRQVHGYPKIVVNRAETTCTDTIHRVRLRDGARAETVAAAFLNSLTFAFSEVIGRSYGGGVLELEPTEAEKLPLPLKGAEELELEPLHERLLKADVNGVLEVTDKALLIDALGLSAQDVKILNGVWAKLRDRRVNRRQCPRRHSGLPGSPFEFTPG
jgi:adenine-specific DNA-methyltransferase